MYFQWTTFEGSTHTSDEYPGPDPTILELICTRPITLLNISLQVQEEAMLTLPPSLKILRITNCRLRTWPNLPTSIQELYADGNDFFHIPHSLSSYKHLIVLQLANGRLETFQTDLPPSLAHCEIPCNALGRIEFPTWPSRLPQVVAYSNPSRLTIDVPSEFKSRILLHESVPVLRPRRPAARHGEIVHKGTISPCLETAIEVGEYTIRRPLPAAVYDGTEIVQPPATVYENTENVHASSIQGSTRKNLEYLVGFAKGRNSKQLLKAIQPSLSYSFSAFILGKLQSNLLKPLKKRLKISYSMHGYTLIRILDGLWERMQQLDAESFETALDRFKEEVEDSHGLCTNGFVVRMSNVLVGLDENIEIRLSASEILQARVPLTMANQRKKGDWKKGEEPWQWSRACFIETVKDLDECEVDAESRISWLEPFRAGLEEELVRDCETLEEIETRWKEWGMPSESWAFQKCIVGFVPKV